MFRMKADSERRQSDIMSQTLSFMSEIENARDSIIESNELFRKIDKDGDGKIVQEEMT